MLSRSDADRDLRIGTFAKNPSPLKFACHSFRPVPGSMRCTSLAGHLFASPDDMGTNSEPYKGLRQSLRCFEPEAIQPERIWLAMVRKREHSQRAFSAARAGWRAVAGHDKKGRK